MVPSKRRLQRWGLMLVALVALLEIAYVLSANAVLRGDLLLRLLNRDPDRLSIAWSSGWSLIPGRLSVESLTLSGRSGQHRWALSAGAAEVDLSLWQLPFRTLNIGFVRADRVSASFRPLAGGRLPKRSAPLRPNRALPLPSLSIRPPRAPLSKRSGWMLGGRSRSARSTSPASRGSCSTSIGSPVLPALQARGSGWDPGPSSAWGMRGFACVPARSAGPEALRRGVELDAALRLEPTNLRQAQSQEFRPLAVRNPASLPGRAPPPGSSTAVRRGALAA